MPYANWSRIMKMISRIFKFIRTDIWRMRMRDLSRKRSFVIRPLRIVILATRGFDEDKIYLRASALTFYTLLSIVPVFAMAFGIAKGFGFEKLLQKEILERFQGQEEVLAKAMDFAHSLLEVTKGGVIATIGLVVLFWAIIKLLKNIEDSFNDIWGIDKRRNIGRKFSDYLTVMLICPVLFTMSGSATVFINTQVTQITEKVALIGYLSPLLFFLLKSLPYCVIWGLFTFLYIFMPNTKIGFRSGLLGGVIAGTIYQIVQWGYIFFQVGVARYNAIYGSFAALPLFLIWLQISWLIVLFGAEISFAHQNVDTYEFEPDSQHISPYFRRLLSLGIAHLLIKQFSTGQKPLTADQISDRLGIPIRLVRQILHELVQGGIISEITAVEKMVPAYQPALDINRLTIAYVLEALDQRGTHAIPVAQTEALNALSEALRGLREAIDRSRGNRLLKDI